MLKKRELIEKLCRKPMPKNLANKGIGYVDGEMRL